MQRAINTWMTTDAALQFWVIKTALLLCQKRGGAAGVMP